MRLRLRGDWVHICHALLHNDTFSAGGSDGGQRLVAFGKTSGELLGTVDLPGGAIGTPMTYMLDGRQYIALTVGGGAPYLVALTLPS